MALDQKTLGIGLIGIAAAWLLWPKKASAAPLVSLPTASTAPSVPATSTPKVADTSYAAKLPTLRRGSQGEAVKAWQRYIGVTADGNFGSGTEARTKQVQASYGLTPDGVVGPSTWALTTAGAKPATKAAATVSVNQGLPTGAQVAQQKTLKDAAVLAQALGMATMADEAAKSTQASKGLDYTPQGYESEELQMSVMPSYYGS